MPPRGCHPTARAAHPPVVLPIPQVESPRTQLLQVDLRTQLVPQAPTRQVLQHTRFLATTVLSSRMAGLRTRPVTHRLPTPRPQLLKLRLPPTATSLETRQPLDKVREEHFTFVMSLCRTRQVYNVVLLKSVEKDEKHAGALSESLHRCGAFTPSGDHVLFHTSMFTTRCFCPPVLSCSEKHS